MANTAADNGIVASVLGDNGLMVWIDHVEELIDLTALLALGQHHAIGYAAVRFRLIQLEFVVTVGGIHQFLVELEVGGAIVHPETEVAAGALDVVDASFQLYLEVLQLEEVLIVVIQWDDMAELVVFGSNEHLDNGSLCLVRADVHGELEGLVVETMLAGFDHKAAAIVEGVAAKHMVDIASGHRGVLNIHGIANIGIEVLEVGGQTLGHVDIVNFNTLEAIVNLGVLGEGVHHMPVVAEQVLVHLVEQRIAQGGVVVHEAAGVRFVVLTVRLSLVHNVAEPLVQAAIELFVNAVSIALQHIAEYIDGIDIASVVLVNPVHDALRVQLHVLHILHVVGRVEVVVVGATGIGYAVVVAYAAVEASVHRFVHVELGHLTHIVGQTLHVVARQ